MTRTTTSATPVARRNWAVYLLAAVAVIAGILNFVDAARYMGWLPIATLGDLRFMAPNVQWFAALMAAIVGVIWFVVAGWLWNLNPQGWLFVVVIAIINLIFLLLAVLGQTTFQAVSLEIVTNLVALVLAFLPGTQRAFGRRA